MSVRCRFPTSRAPCRARHNRAGSLRDPPRMERPREGSARGWARPRARFCPAVWRGLNRPSTTPFAGILVVTTRAMSAAAARRGRIRKPVGQLAQGVRIALRIYFITTRIMIVIDYLSNEIGSAWYERPLNATSLRRGATAPHSRTSCTGLPPAPPTGSPAPRRGPRAADRTGPRAVPRCAACGRSRRGRHELIVQTSGIRIFS